MNKIIRNNNAITLIALVITIIVMLILVTVTIRISQSGNLFKHAANATSKTKIEVNKETEIAEGTIGGKTIDEWVNGEKINYVGSFVNYKGVKFVITEQNGTELTLKPLTVSSDNMCLLSGKYTMVNGKKKSIDMNLPDSSTALTDTNYEAFNERILQEQSDAVQEIYGDPIGNQIHIEQTDSFGIEYYTTLPQNTLSKFEDVDDILVNLDRLADYLEYEQSSTLSLIFFEKLAAARMISNFSSATTWNNEYLGCSVEDVVQFLQEKNFENITLENINIGNHENVYKLIRMLFLTIHLEFNNLGSNWTYETLSAGETWSACWDAGDGVCFTALVSNGEYFSEENSISAILKLNYNLLSKVSDNIYTINL